MLNEGSVPQSPHWPHLRAAYAHTVQPSTYLNKLTLPQWKKLFEEAMPGVSFVHERQDGDMAAPLKALRDAGELAQYTDEELLTVNLVAVWKKPNEATASTRAPRQ